jgi:hypothetical protein
LIEEARKLKQGEQEAPLILQDVKAKAAAYGEGADDWG